MILPSHIFRLRIIECYRCSPFYDCNRLGDELASVFQDHLRVLFPQRASDELEGILWTHYIALAQNLDLFGLQDVHLLGQILAQIHHLDHAEQHGGSITCDASSDKC